MRAEAQLISCQLMSSVQSSPDRVNMLVVGDMEDVFVPMADGIFVDPRVSQYVLHNSNMFLVPLTSKARTSIESLLRSLPEQSAETAFYDSALGAALIAAMGTLVSGSSHPVSRLCSVFCCR